MILGARGGGDAYGIPLVFFGSRDKIPRTRVMGCSVESRDLSNRLSSSVEFDCIVLHCHIPLTDGSNFMFRDEYHAGPPISVSSSSMVASSCALGCGQRLSAAICVTEVVPCTNNPSKYCM